MDQEEREEIMRESYETLERLRDLQVTPRENETHEWQLPPREPPKRQRKLDTAVAFDGAVAFDWTTEMDARFAHHKAYLHDLLVELVSQLQERMHKALAKQQQQHNDKLVHLELEIAKANERIAELRLAEARANNTAKVLLFPNEKAN
jgi:hypothetical protein